MTLRGLFWIFQLGLAAAVAFLVANLYYNNGAGFGVAIEPMVYRVVTIAVFAVPVFWAAANLIGGLMASLVVGSFMDAMKLSILMGGGMALSRLWLYVVATAVGLWAGGGPLTYTIGAAVIGGLLFGLEKIMNYFWRVYKESVPI